MTIASVGEAHLPIVSMPCLMANGASVLLVQAAGVAMPDGSPTIGGTLVQGSAIDTSGVAVQLGMYAWVKQADWVTPYTGEVTLRNVDETTHKTL